jgi:PAS domain S-box-containing protein
MPVEANRVYVIPPNMCMTISGGVFRLTGPIQRRGLQRSIEEEFQSLNEELSTVNNQLRNKVQELEAANNDLSNLLKMTDVVTVFLDPGFRIKRFMPAATKLFKLINTDVGRPIGDLEPRFSDPNLLCDVEQVLRDLVPRDKEVKSEDGCWWIRRIAPCRTWDNRIEGVSLTFGDITVQQQAREELEKELEKRTEGLATINERLHQEIEEHQRVIVEHQQAEKSLRDREARLQAIIDTAVDAIITIDERGLIQSTNPASEKMFGYANTELIGQNVSILMSASSREKHDGYLMHYLQTGYKRIIGIGREVSGRRKDGTVFPVDLAVSEMHADGGGFTGILHDITRRKELEREILEIAGLEQKRIGQDLHDNLGQELTALGLLTDALLEAIREHSPADLDLTCKINQGLKRSLAQVRAISRGLVAEVNTNGLRAVLEDLAAHVGENPGVHCTFHGDESFALENDSKARHLFLIAQQACANALKHGHAKNIEISLHLRDDLLVLEVKDDGIGIPLRPQEGLGLRIMRNRAAVIQAGLTIETVEPHGTLVTCALRGACTHEPHSRHQ